MRVLVFLHGTTIMHAAGVGCTRAERVAQVASGSDPSVRDFGNYVPVGAAAAKLRAWAEHGAEISYLSSHRRPERVALDAAVIARHGFPHGEVHARADGETYGDVVARVAPQLLVEDDCESIGFGEVAAAQTPAPARGRLVSVVVPEFGGIDHLPDDPREVRG